MESFGDRLKRLRRDPAPGAPKTSPAPVEESPHAGVGERRDWLRKRLRDRAATQGERRSAQNSPASGLPTTQHATSKGMPRDLAEFSNVHGSFAARVIDLPAEHQHGHFRLSEVDAAEDLAWLARDAALLDFDPRRAVYLDIETTGLSGGAGTWPFMVALGRFEGDRFVLWQGFMRNPHEEAALLFEVAARIHASSGVVSFFGKSFDRHRLEDKMRMHSIPAGFAERPHLDLYYPLNRLYTRRASWDKLARGAAAPPGGGLGDGKLGTMERGLIGLKRQADLSGAHAPAAWFAFLDQRPHLLEEVFRHNALDVWSLVALLAHLGRTKSEMRADGTPLAGPPLARALGLAGLARDHGERAVECAYLDLAHHRLEAEPVRGFLNGIQPEDRVPAQAPAEMALWQADALRLAGESERALAAYTALEIRRQLPARVLAQSAAERAKLLERATKDFAAALSACEVARAAAVRGLCSARFRAELDKRAARLQTLLKRDNEQA